MSSESAFSASNSIYSESISGSEFTEIDNEFAEDWDAMNCIQPLDTIADNAPSSIEKEKGYLTKEEVEEIMSYRGGQEVSAFGYTFVCQERGSIPRVPLPSQSMEEAPVYVNVLQYNRILKRREQRERLQAKLKLRPRYMHESRHKHACRRRRGPGGRFLSKDEIQQLEEQYIREQENEVKIISADGTIVGESSVSKDKFFLESLTAKSDSSSSSALSEKKKVAADSKSIKESKRSRTKTNKRQKRSTSPCLSSLQVGSLEECLQGLQDEWESRESKKSSSSSGSRAGSSVNAPTGLPTLQKHSSSRSECLSNFFNDDVATKLDDAPASLLFDDFQHNNDLYFEPLGIEDSMFGKP